MRNGIDDYFFDVLRDQKGIELPSEVMDDRELKILHLASASFQHDRRARGGLVWRAGERKLSSTGPTPSPFWCRSSAWRSAPPRLGTGSLGSRPRTLRPDDGRVGKECVGTYHTG